MEKNSLLIPGMKGRKFKERIKKAFCLFLKVFMASYEALNFADGRRSILDIVRAISAEFEPVDFQNIYDFFKILERTELVILKQTWRKMNFLNKRTSFQQLVHSRKSIRRFLDKPVEREKILSCLEAARVAPSADNVQPWRFLVIDDPEIIKDFAKEAFSGIYFPSKFAAKAPIIIVILARLDIIANRIGKQIQNISFYLIDIGIAGEHIVLQAEDLGLGTCWIGWFNARKTRKFFKIPRKYKIVSLMAMGYYEKKPSKERKRKKLEEIIWFNKME